MEDRKNFVMRAIEHMQAIDKKVSALYELGVDIIDEDTLVDTRIIEESISYVIAGEYDDGILEMVSWWIYEDVEKKVTMGEVEVDLVAMVDFVDWLFETFGV